MHMPMLKPMHMPKPTPKPKPRAPTHPPAHPPTHLPTRVAAVDIRARQHLVLQAVPPRDGPDRAPQRAVVPGAPAGRRGAGDERHGPGRRRHEPVRLLGPGGRVGARLAGEGLRGAGWRRGCIHAAPLEQKRPRLAGSAGRRRGRSDAREGLCAAQAPAVLPRRGLLAANRSWRREVLLTLQWRVYPRLWTDASDPGMV